VIDVMEASKDEVGRGCKRHCDFGGEPGDSVGDALGTGLPDPDGVAAIGVEGWAEVPAVEGMRGPGGAIAGLVMDEDSNARWGNRRAIKVKGAVHLGPCRELGIKAGAAEEVEREEGLGHEAIP
jgi:hypothetical protein